MSDTTLIQRLRKDSEGRDEWRVQSPADGAYCIAFAWPESLDPECEARSWLADHIKRFPNGRFVDYVVACVRVTSEADRRRLEAADSLEQQSAQIAEKDAEIARMKAEVEALRADAERLRDALQLARNEISALPASLGYAYTSLPQIDAALRQEQPT
jgi:cell division protein FtsB